VGPAPRPLLAVARAVRRRPLAVLDAAALGVLVLLLVPLAGRLARAIGGPADVALGLAAALAGYAGADLLSGLVHWLGDRFFEEDTPLVGRALIRPFREHHRAPRAMVAHGFLELTGNSCLVLLPVAAAAPAAPAGIFTDAALLALAITGVLTNLFHRWAHTPAPPRMAAWLQRSGLVLSPAAHARHHGGAFDGAYCVTSGWLNPLVDRLGLFARLEPALAALGLPRARAS
jgi:hypothetical protein